MKKLFPFFYLCLFALVFSLSVNAQTLSVREIMREPSLAGMRPDAERLSPDGRFVIFTWNPEGREPRNLYLVNSDGSNLRLLVNAAENYEPRAAQPESKLNYGLIVRDDFARAREKNLGGVDIAPDSRRILFSQNTDIYVLELDSQSKIAVERAAESVRITWQTYEKAMLRRADFMPNLIKATQTAAVQEPEIFARIAEARARLLNALNEKAQGAGGDKSETQKAAVIEANDDLSRAIDRVKNLPERYPPLESSEIFQNHLNELSGNENRLAVGKRDFELARQYALNKPRRITRTQTPEAGARWLSSDAILYASGGNWFVLNIKDASLIQVTREANPQAFVSVFNATPTKDGRLLAYVVSDGSRQRALFVPNFLDEYVQTPSIRRGWTEQKILVAPTDGSRERPFEVRLPRAEGNGYIRGLRWAADNSSLIVDRIDQDLKRRQLFYVHDVGSKAEQIILITEERDEKWIAPLSRIIEANPRNEAQIFFASERDGYNHLYLATLERAAHTPNPSSEIRQENPMDAGFTTKVEIRQLTKGAWQVEWASWNPKTSEIIFLSTAKGTATRQFSIISSDGKNTAPFDDVDPKQNGGMIESPQIATNFDGNAPQVLYGFSKWNQPTELVAEKLCFNCSATENAYNPVKLTNSTPERFKQIKWSEPRFVDIPTRDGKIVKSKVYLPQNFNAKRKYPMVVFVHGAGYLQNTINGWNNYYREFMFNHILTERGYVVLDIDYRGSAGYGRDWRTDVFDFLGGKDYEDHLDAIDYAVKNYAVDERKIGVYGGSYGGFMAGMLVLRAPEKIAAAAALRPVFDWKNYYAANPTYTAERLGYPDKNAEAYRRSSPIAYAENLRKPLLILHGMVDDNVHAQDSIQMIEKLMRLEKTEFFEAMLYPSENHAFTRPTSWADEYERILRFFEKHLQ